MKSFLTLVLVFAMQVFPVFARANCDGDLGGEAAAAGGASGLRITVKKDFIRQRDGLPIYFEQYKVPRSKGLLVISNGLEYDLGHYAATIAELNKAGFSVLLYAHRAQHQSLEAATAEKIKFGAFTYQDLANDLEDLLEVLKIKKPFHLTSISFGAATAAEFARRHPEQLKSLSFQAPLVTLSTVYGMARDVQASVSLWNPFATLFMPDLTTPYERMITAVSTYDLEKFKFEVPTTLILAGVEQKALKTQQAKYWDHYLSQQGGQLVEIEEANHGIPSSAPVELAKVLAQIMTSAGKP